MNLRLAFNSLVAKDDLELTFGLFFNICSIFFFSHKCIIQSLRKIRIEVRFY